MNWKKALPFIQVLLLGIPYGYVLVFKKIRQPNDLDTLFLIYLPLFISTVLLVKILISAAGKSMKMFFSAITLPALIIFLLGYQAIDAYADRIYYHLHENRLNRLVEMSQSFESLEQLQFDLFLGEDYLNGQPVDGQTFNHFPGLTHEDYLTLKNALHRLGFNTLEKYDACVKLIRQKHDLKWGLIYFKEDYQPCLSPNASFRLLTENWGVIYE